MEKTNIPKEKRELTEAEKEYFLALEIGKKRFGSPCKHEEVENGVCCNCLRKVVS